MADNSDMEVMTVLPKELRLGAPPTMPQARSYLFRQQSTLSAYNPDDQIQINIPRLQRSYLSKDSYLQFRLNGQFQPGTPIIEGTDSQFVPDLFLDDAGAWGLFERMEVFDYLGSTVLETTDGLPQLMSLLIDMGADFTDPEHEGPVAHGLSNSYTASIQNDSSTTFSVLANTNVTFPATVGPNATIGIAIGTGTSYTYTFPGGTYATYALFYDALQEWLETLTVNNVAGGTPLNISARPSNIRTNATDLVSTSGAFTVTISGTGATALANFLGMFTTGTPAFNGTATSQGTEIASTNGVGKSFYCGGKLLAAFGTTRAVTKRSFSYKFSIPLPSFLGFLSKKMVPLHNGFTIVLTIASKFKPMFMAAKQVPVIIVSPTSNTDTSNIQRDVKVEALNTIEPRVNSVPNINQPNKLPDPAVFWWNLTDVTLVCQILELGPVAESMILSSSQGQPLIVHSKQLRSYRGNISATVPEFSLPLNLNVSSLTDVLWFMRPNGTENDLRYASVGSRLRNFLWRWEFQYGSTVLPQSQGIQCMEMTGPVVPSGMTAFAGGELVASQANGFTECYNELIKARPNIPHRGRMSIETYSSIYNIGFSQMLGFGVTPWRCINGPSANMNSTLQSGAESEIGKFACGLNTELVTGKSGDLICGLNTNGMNTSIRGYFHPSYLTNTNRADSSIDAYAEYDAFVNISPGIATTISY